MLEHCITSRIQLDFNFNKREWNWFEHDKYHRCGEGWSRGTRRRKKDRRQNTILSRNLYLQLLISPQSLQFFPQGLSQQEASQAFAFFHCRPAKRLKQRFGFNQVQSCVWLVWRVFRKWICWHFNIAKTFVHHDCKLFTSFQVVHLLLVKVLTIENF